MGNSAVQQLLAAALLAADRDTAEPHERVDMLVDIAEGLQRRPKDAEQLRGAVELYERAITLCAPDEGRFARRIRARMGSARSAVVSTR